MAEYATAAGFVQFDVTERDIPSGDTVRDVTIRTLGSDGVLVRLTVWPDFAEAEIEKGDFVAADGKYEERVAQDKEGKNRTYRNLNVRELAVVPAVSRKEPEVVNKKSRSKQSF